jgi:hypothetical protein
MAFVFDGIKFRVGFEVARRSDFLKLSRLKINRAVLLNYLWIILGSTALNSNRRQVITRENYPINEL